MQAKWAKDHWEDQHGNTVKLGTPFRCKYKGVTLICVMGHVPTFINTKSLKEFKITGLVDVLTQGCTDCGR